MNAAKLEIPFWVPGPISSLAQTLYTEATLRPLEPFKAHAEALRRVATNERMHDVWTELYRRRGGVSRRGPYVHPARPEMVRACPQFRGVEDISQRVDERDRVQDQAAAVLFLVVTGNALWDRRYNIGPRTRTAAEVNDEIATRRELAERHEKDASEYARLGDWQAAQTLRNLAAEARRQADPRSPDPRNPWIVKRLSSRSGDEWDRGMIIDITQTCLILYGKKLLGTVTTLSNVVLGREDISKGTVQGVVKHIR